MKKQIIIYSFLFIAVVGSLAVISLKYKTNIKLGKLITKTEKKEKRVIKNKQPHVAFQVNTDIDLTTIAIKMYIPCRDTDQRNSIDKALPRIKSDLIDEIRQDSLSRLIENREFDEIKIRLMKVINKHVADGIDDLYLDYFNLMSKKW